MAGRVPGSRNFISTEQKRRIAAANNHGMSPLEYLLAVFQDTTLSDSLRLDAAKAAAPYVHPRLSAIEHSGAIGLRHAADMSDNELAMIAADSEPMVTLPHPSPMPVEQETIEQQPIEQEPKPKRPYTPQRKAKERKISPRKLRQAVAAARVERLTRLKRAATNAAPDKPSGNGLYAADSMAEAD